MAMGRPSEFTQEIGDDICSLLVSGLSLRSICKKDEFPSVGTVLRWVGKDKEFEKQYTRARLEQADVIFDEMLDVKTRRKVSFKHPRPQTLQ